MLAIEKNDVSADVLVMNLNGRVCMGRDVQQVEWAVDELLTKNYKVVILDMSKVTHIDSTGIGIVVLSAGKLKNGGSELRLAGAAGLVDSVLRMTKVDSLVPMFASVAEAAQGSAAAGA